MTTRIPEISWDEEIAAKTDGTEVYVVIADNGLVLGVYADGRDARLVADYSDTRARPAVWDHVTGQWVVTK
jgi:hypothetical protein